jgi:hypothetical protein
MQPMISRPSPALLLAAALVVLAPRGARAENSVAYKYSDYREAGGRVGPAPGPGLELGGGGGRGPGQQEREQQQPGGQFGPPRPGARAQAEGVTAASGVLHQGAAALQGEGARPSAGPPGWLG